MKFSAFLFLVLIGASCSHHQKSDSGKSSCTVLKDCLDIASKLTGKSYFYDDIKLNREVGQSGKVVWTKENADFIIGEMLAAAGYNRIQTSTENTYHLMNARDIRYASNIKSYSATLDTNDQLPPANSADPGELVYVSKNPGRASELARNLRPFLGRYGRVIDVVASNMIILRDTTAAIHQMLPLIRKMDVPMTKEESVRMEKRNKEVMERMKKSKKGEPEAVNAPSSP